MAIQLSIILAIIYLDTLIVWLYVHVHVMLRNKCIKILFRNKKCDLCLINCY